VISIGEVVGRLGVRAGDVCALKIGQVRLDDESGGTPRFAA